MTYHYGKAPAEYFFQKVECNKNMTIFEYLMATFRKHIISDVSRLFIVIF